MISLAHMLGGSWACSPRESFENLVRPDNPFIYNENNLGDSIPPC